MSRSTYCWNACEQNVWKARFLQGNNIFLPSWSLLTLESKPSNYSKKISINESSLHICINIGTHIQAQSSKMGNQQVISLYWLLQFLIWLNPLVGKGNLTTQSLFSAIPKGLGKQHNSAYLKETSIATECQKWSTKWLLRTATSFFGFSLEWWKAKTYKPSICSTDQWPRWQRRIKLNNQLLTVQIFGKHCEAQDARTPSPLRQRPATQ